MNRVVTTLLDVLGLLLLAAGAFYLAEPAMGRAGLLVAGVVVLGGSALADRTQAAVTAPAWWRRLAGRWREDAT